MDENKQNKVLAFDTAVIHNATRMAKKKPEQLAVRPTPADWELIKELREKTGLATASLLRLALRRLAESEGLKIAS